MKKILLIIAISAAGMGHSVANATGTPPNASATSATTDTMPVLEVQESAYKGYLATMKSFEEFRGSYAMEDGSTLNLYRHGRAFYAELNSQPSFPISAVSTARFVTSDGRTAIAFQQLPNGLVSQVVLTRPVNGLIVSLRGAAADKG